MRRAAINLTVTPDRISLCFHTLARRGRPNSEGHNRALSRSFKPMNSREYRRWRQRRRAAWAEVNRTRKHRDTEAERLIEFASIWIPYGGPNEEDILVHFGMSRLRFIERLWQVMPESNCAREEICSLASTYPAPPSNGRSASRSVCRSAGHVDGARGRRSDGTQAVTQT